MKRPTEPVFLAVQSYRRRRLRDVARVLPFVGGFLFLLPTLWSIQAGTVAVTAYVFTVWVGLILMSGVVAHRLREDPGDDDDIDADAEDG